MQLRVLGCHGGETPKHRTSSFLIGDRVAIDAGALTGSLSLAEQERIESVLVSHSHMDHIRDLGMLADNRCQQGGPTIEIIGVPATIDSLRAHFFNDKLWPDFTKIHTDSGPVVRFVEAPPEQKLRVGELEITPVMVDHTVDTSAFVLEQNGVSLVYGGDTGPTKRLWEHVNALPNVQALMMEVSFPNDEERLATESCHHTPRSLDRELDKLSQRAELPILLYHIKPVFESRVLRELGQLRDRNLQILRIDDEFLF
jgi:cAMP phosphodiesterase